MHRLELHSWTIIWIGPHSSCRHSNCFSEQKCTVVCAQSCCNIYPPLECSVIEYVSALWNELGEHISQMCTSKTGDNPAWHSHHQPWLCLIRALQPGEIWMKHQLLGYWWLLRYLHGNVMECTCVVAHILLTYSLRYFHWYVALWIVRMCFSVVLVPCARLHTLGIFVFILLYKNAQFVVWIIFSFSFGYFYHLFY